MRDVVLYELMSLDGVAEEPSWFMDAGPEVFDNLGRVIGSQDDVLLGRRTYDDCAAHWPASDLEPFASLINTTPLRERLVDADRSPGGTLFLAYRA